MKRIKDDDPSQPSSYFRLVFCRSNRTSEICLISWMWLTLIELMLGEELIEQLTITAAYNEPTAAKSGHPLHLNDLVPYGLVTNLFRQRVLQIFYYKYHKQYDFLRAEAKPDESDNEVDTRGSRFAVAHDSLHRLISFRRVYVVAAVVFNFITSFAVFVFGDLILALLTSLAIEGLRRLARL